MRRKTGRNGRPAHGWYGRQGNGRRVWTSFSPTHNSNGWPPPVKEASLGDPLWKKEPPRPLPKNF